ncbi:MAG: ribbon-helix-helix domain-containing protein [Lacisediminihabitans sp.]
MSKQITIRLPDDLVEFLDDLVASGAEASRASIVTRALKRERRRSAAMRDVEILKNSPVDPDLDAFAAWAVSQPIGLD